MDASEDETDKAYGHTTSPFSLTRYDPGDVTHHSWPQHKLSPQDGCGAPPATTEDNGKGPHADAQVTQSRPALLQGGEMAKSGCCSYCLVKIKILEDENFSLAKSSSFTGSGFMVKTWNFLLEAEPFCTASQSGNRQGSTPDAPAPPRRLSLRATQNSTASLHVRSPEY